MTDSFTYRISLRTPQRRLLDAAQQDDRAALLELVRAYEPLVQRVVWRLRPPRGCEREDLAQEARIGLLTAIRAWRPERGPFPAFADRCVTNQALLALQAAARHKHQILSRAVHLEAAQAGDTQTRKALLRSACTTCSRLPGTRASTLNLGCSYENSSRACCTLCQP